MKKTLCLAVVLSLMLFGTGCENRKTRAAEGAVVGSVLGAAAGGIIGHQSGSGAEGAGIGAAVGAISGAIIGSQIERPQSQTTSEAQPANPNQLTQQEIVNLTKQGVHEDVIIDKIHLTNSKFNLTALDIDYLKQQGVSQKVINAMQGM